MSRKMVPGMILAAAALITAPGAFAGDLEVVTTVADGKKIVSGVLIAEGQSLPLTDGGKKLLRGLPDKRIAVTVDALVGDKGGARYLGVTETKTLPGKTVAVTVTLRPVTDIEAFCSQCHPSQGDVVKPNQVVRDVHVSGKELTGRYLEQVKKHNEKAELQKKSNAPKPELPILLEERVVAVDGKQGKKFFFTCESCHTTHVKTVWTKSARASFASKPSTLCTGCHY